MNSFNPYDNWTLFCETTKFLSQTPSNIIITPVCSYPKDLPTWYTEQDDIVSEIFPDDLFFDPYKTIAEETRELEHYEDTNEPISDDESDEYSDYEWDKVKNKF